MLVCKYLYTNPFKLRCTTRVVGGNPMETVVNCVDGQLRVKSTLSTKLILCTFFSCLSVHWDFPPLPYIYCCRIKLSMGYRDHMDMQGGGADVKHICS